MSDHILPPMSVEFYPNTGMEVGWCIALERELRREGWNVWSEVSTSRHRIADMFAVLGPVQLVIEVKANAAGPSAVQQIARYLEDVRQTNPRALGVLAAPRLTFTVGDLPDDIYFLPLRRA